jgi:hypothetical protein
MGEAASLIACRDGRVVGTLGLALRKLVLPNGERQPSAYLGDLKISPSAQGGRVLPRLADRARDWVGQRVTTAFAVVMGGTAATPERYTGRLGIPEFREVGRVSVLRFSTSSALLSEPGWLRPLAAVRSVLPVLSENRYYSDGGNPNERSESDPVGLVAPNGSACGWVEDTARAKRLLTDDASEMRSAHLSGFGYVTAAAGGALIRHALAVAAQQSFPALFVAVPAEDAPSFLHLLQDVPVTNAPATVYGVGFRPGSWNVNTAEI